MYVISFGEAQILLTPSPIEEINKRNITNAYIVNKPLTQDVFHLLKDVEEGRLNTIVVGGDPDARLIELKQIVRCLKAGGGLVVNEHGDVLMIHRNGVWDLPKGKWEHGESMMECALREVEEETGIHTIQVGDLIDITRHIYYDANGYILKESYWYAMKAPKQILVPQTEEGISEACWVQQNEIHKHLLNTYYSIKYIVEKSGYV